ncbi:MAG TPA: Rne/Rng family ribonuclease [Blastocatellia bacterium]|nr:Rne/Rng family ribonuclease [Blastocatellia bacterium]
MPKELIISANAHEKKVAIIEDGVVTEFYVERVNENTGVVGNIYKGRVMKVLPGMQSAFVDIGLERDAFLYVSDFLDLDDEEAIEIKDDAAELASPRGDRRDRRPAGDRDADVREVPAIAAAPPIVAARPVEPVEALVSVTDEDEEETAEGEEAGGRRRRRRRRRRRSDEQAPGMDEYDVPAEKPTVLDSFGDDDASHLRVESAYDHIEEVAFDDNSRKARASAYPLPDSNLERVSDDDAPPRARNVKPLVEEVVAVTSSTWYDEPAPQTAHEEVELIPVRDEEPSTEAGARKSRARKAPAAAAPKSRARKAKSDDEAVDDAAPKRGRARKTRDDDEGSEPKARKSRARKAAVGTPIEAVRDAFAQDDDVSAVDEPDVNLDDDRGAEVAETPVRSEMATRRGGRNRRRRPADGGGGAGENGDGGERTESAEGESADVEVAAEPRESMEAVEAAEPRQQREPREPRESRGPREPREAREESEPRQPREPREQRERSEPRQQRERREPRQQRDRDRRPGRSGSAAPAGGDGAPAAPATGGRSGRRGAEPLISDLLHEGQEIIVQIAKEPIAKKGARITSHVVLPGRFLVYMPTVNRIGVSRKVSSESERVRLKRVVSALREREPGPGGFIARTAAVGQSDEDLLDDMRYLQRTWADIKIQSDRKKAPAGLHRDLDLVQRILRDQISDDFSAIRIDNEIEYARVVDFVHRVQPKLVRRVKLHTRDESIFETHGVQAEIDKALKPRVWLKSGGYIVINQTEALVSIDVNTGKFVGKSDRLEDTITRTNMEAVKEIVRQVRLRDLGGIIVIDFIDMEERRNRMKVAAALEQELRADRSPSKVLGFNDFGLIIITRKRVKQSLERTLCSPCPYCQGAGLVKSTQTVAFEILSEARRLSKHVGHEADDITLRVSPDVAQALRTTESSLLEEIEAHFSNPIRLKVDHELHQEQFDFAII